MKRILLILALLSFALSAQTRYYWPSPVNSSNGRPLNNAAVYLFDTSQDTSLGALTFATGSDGRYYRTTAIPTGTYTLKYLSGGTYYSIAGHVGVKITDWSLSELREIVGDSVAALSADGVTVLNDGTLKQKVFPTTAALSLASADSVGMTAVVKDNGVFMYDDSSAYEDGNNYLAASTAGYQWKRLSYFDNTFTNNYLRDNEYFYRDAIKQNTQKHFHAAPSYNRNANEIIKGSPFLTSTISAPKWAFLGNSITRQSRSAYFEMIEHKFGFAGLGFDPIADPAFGSRVTITSNITATYVVSSRSYDSQKKWGATGSSAVLITGDSIEYTPSGLYGKFTDARIWYGQTPSGGDFDYSVDGGSATSVNTAGTEALKAIRIKGLSGNSEHYITINNIVTDTDSVRIYGIETWLDTLNSGLIPIFMAAPGSEVSTWNLQNDWYRTFLDSIQPANMSIYLGANDGANGRTPALYSSNITQLVDTMLAIDPYMSITLYTQYDRGKDADYTIKDTTISNRFEVYRDSLFQIAERKGCSVLDLRALYPSHAEAIAKGMYDDVIHPSVIGENFIAYVWSQTVNADPYGYALRDHTNTFRAPQAFTYGSESSPSIVFWARTGSGTPTAGNTGWWTTNGDIWNFSYQGTKRISIGSNLLSQNNIFVYPTASVPSILGSMRQGSASVAAWEIQTNSSHHEVHTANRVTFNNDVQIGGASNAVITDAYVVGSAPSDTLVFVVGGVEYAMPRRP